MKIVKSLKKRAVTISMILTAFIIAFVMAAVLVSASIQRNQQEAFDHLTAESETFISFILEHFLGGTSVLRSTSAYFISDEAVTRGEFYDFAKNSNFLESFPGFQTLGYAQLVSEDEQASFIADISSDTSVDPAGYPEFHFYPNHAGNEYLPIIFIYPEEDVGFLMGLDSFGDPIRMENALNARDSGDIAISDLVELGEGGSGVVLAMPVYEKDGDLKTLAGRREAYIGTVTTVIDTEKFFAYGVSQSNLNEYGIHAAITENTEDGIVIHPGSTGTGLLQKIYGNVEIRRELPLTLNTTYSLAFSAPAYRFLSHQEAYEPIVLALGFLAAFLFMSLIILVSQRAREIADLSKRYEFISTLSHQLRTPLTRLQWSLETKGRKASTELTDVSLNVRVLRSIVDRMLAYLEITSKSIKLKREAVPVEAILKRVMQKVEDNSGADRLERIGRKRVNKKLFADPDRIASVLWYVIENALIYSPKNKAVTLEVVPKNTRVQFRVSDLGNGIPKKEQPDIFKEFFRTSNASLGKNAGSGVSLHIAKQIVEAHGGKISFTSQEGKGTTFTVSLPESAAPKKKAKS